MRWVNLVGRKLDRLTVIEKPTERDSRGTYKYKCLCECGKIVFLTTNCLSNRYHTKSCGCLKAENVRKATRREWGVSAFESLYHHYQRNAGMRKLEFSLSLDEFKDITHRNCYYCCIEPRQVFKSRTNYGGYVYNGIDRIDNTRGYTIDNCVPCCGTCNVAKGKLSIENFLNLIERVYLHRCTL